MKTQNSLKLKLVSFLPLAVLAMQILSVFMFKNIDSIVHGDLYNFGLKFNSSWAQPYWDTSFSLLDSLTVAAGLIAFSFLLVIVYLRTNKKLITFAVSVLAIPAACLNIFSAYLFTRIDYIVHHDLYEYGLKFSADWATPYADYMNSLFVLIGLGSTIILLTPVLILLLTRTRSKIERHELKRVITGDAKLPPTKMISYLLIASGIISLVTSVFFVSSILTFIGLGLLFWGVLFTYIRTEDYIKKSIFEATTYSQHVTLNQLIQELKYDGIPVYLPPKYFKNPDTHKAFIPKQKNTTLPTAEKIQQQEAQVFLKQPLGLLLTPPGSDLTKLFEQTMNTNFTRVNIQYLQQNLPKLFVEELEIAQNFEMITRDNEVSVKIEHLTYKLFNENNQLCPLASPLRSAIACTLAKTTGKPVIIEKQQTILDGKNEITHYRILEEEVSSTL